MHAGRLPLARSSRGDQDTTAQCMTVLNSLLAPVRQIKRVMPIGYDDEKAELMQGNRRSL